MCPKRTVDSRLGIPTRVSVSFLALAVCTLLTLTARTEKATIGVKDTRRSVE
jgi:hypothetical protein